MLHRLRHRLTAGSVDADGLGIDASRRREEKDKQCIDPVEEFEMDLARRTCAPSALRTTVPGEAGVPQFPAPRSRASTAPVPLLRRRPDLNRHHCPDPRDVGLGYIFLFSRGEVRRETKIKRFEGCFPLWWSMD